MHLQQPRHDDFTFSHELIDRLLHLPHVAGVKMPLPTNGDFTGEMADLRSRTPEGFEIGYSGDWGAKDALLAGAEAWFSVVAGLLPGPALQLERAAASGDVQEAVRIDQAFEPFWTLFKEFGSFRVMYELADLLDGNAIEPLRPVQSLVAGARQKMQGALNVLEGIVSSDR